MKKTLTKKLDKAWSIVIRQKGACEVCGKRDFLNAHHCISRSFRSLRWDLRNGCCLCAGCHTFKNQSAHKNPIWFNQWLENNRPEDLKYLKDKQWQITKIDDKQGELMLTGLNELIN